HRRTRRRHRLRPGRRRDDRDRAAFAGLARPPSGRRLRRRRHPEAAGQPAAAQGRVPGRRVLGRVRAPRARGQRRQHPRTAGLAARGRAAAAGLAPLPAVAGAGRARGAAGARGGGQAGGAAAAGRLSSAQRRHGSRSRPRSPHWPPGLPHRLELPRTSLYENLAISARRYPQRPATLYYGGGLDYAQLAAQVDALAGFLQQRCGVARGDRVALFMQNCPQFVVAVYAILRADAVVVPVNSMNRLEEVRHIVRDSGARTALVAQELAPELLPLRGELLDHVVVATYSDYIDAGTDLPLPEVVAQPRQAFEGAIGWNAALEAGLAPSAHLAGPDDLAVMPYTSGTTGAPRGCLHTHRSVMHTAVAGPEWCFVPKDTVVLASLPMFHVTGLQNGINTPVYRGNTMVVMTRWDRRCAALLIERHRAGAWTAIPTMLMDFLAQDLSAFDLSSMHVLTGGGAAMPRAVAERIRQLWGIDYVEGYGLSETMAPTHLNPVHRPKPQCLGLPILDTDSRVVDPLTLEELPTGEVGEIVTHGPQVMLGYHGRPEDDPGSFAEIDGKRFLRTGDLAYVDAEGC